MGLHGSHEGQHHHRQRKEAAHEVVEGVPLTREMRDILKNQGPAKGREASTAHDDGTAGAGNGSGVDLRGDLPQHDIGHGCACTHAVGAVLEEQGQEPRSGRGVGTGDGEGEADGGAQGRRQDHRGLPRDELRHDATQHGPGHGGAGLDADLPGGRQGARLGQHYRRGVAVAVHEHVDAQGCEEHRHAGVAQARREDRAHLLPKGWPPPRAADRGQLRVGHVHALRAVEPRHGREGLLGLAALAHARQEDGRLMQEADAEKPEDDRRQGHEGREAPPVQVPVGGVVGRG
mmetsp:Transcript_116797/g.362919  ORF Transcript_116797/g.362919 Transcript_116797/m.362919 type:complete len:289 (-) Transcript_116797:591-1457(-)